MTHRLCVHFVMPNSTMSTLSLYYPTSTMGTLQLVGREKKSYCFHFNSQIIIYVIICPPTRAIISFRRCQWAFYSLQHCGNIEVITDQPSNIHSTFRNVVDFDVDKKHYCLFIFLVSNRKKRKKNQCACLWRQSL